MGYVFRDEFDGPAGSAPDPANWSYDLGKWPYNNEAETYTDSRANSFIDGKSHLVIRPTLENGVYYSARLNTLNKAQFAHGNFSARIKLPLVPGLWPSFWMLGANMSKVSWPQCGEVDLVEWYGNMRWGATTTLHVPDSSNNDSSRYSLVDVTEGWHIYRVSWRDDSMTFALDGKPYWSVRSSTMTSWPFTLEHEMFMLLNVAIGGDGGGALPAGTSLAAGQADMLVDWVRVWQA